MGFLKLKMHQNPFSAGTPPRTRWGSLRVKTPPRHPSRLGRGTPPFHSLSFGASLVTPPPPSSLWLVPTLDIQQCLTQHQRWSTVSFFTLFLPPPPSSPLVFTPLSLPPPPAFTQHQASAPEHVPCRDPHRAQHPGKASSTRQRHKC